MKGQLKKISIIFVMIITITIFFVSSRSMALEVQTHRAINEYIAQTPLNNFFLDDYLKTQLGMQTGVKTKYNNQEAFKWLGDGGVTEDKPDGCIPYRRSINHFINPLDDSCFSGLWGTSLAQGVPADQWALSPLGTQYCEHYSCGEFGGQYT